MIDESLPMFGWTQDIVKDIVVSAVIDLSLQQFTLAKKNLGSTEKFSAEGKQWAEAMGLRTGLYLEKVISIFGAILISLCGISLKMKYVAPHVNKLNICTDYAICPRDKIPVNE